MVSIWVLIACIIGAFSLGALFMAIVQASHREDDAPQSRRLEIDGLHPLDSPSQA